MWYNVDMYMDSGQPLSPEEATLVETALVRDLRLRNHLSTPDFIRSLGWPQRRLPDLRRHLEYKSYGVALRVSTAVGIPFKSLACTRKDIYYSDDESYDPEALERQSEHAIRSSMRLLAQGSTDLAVARFALGQAQSTLHLLLPLAGLKEGDKSQILAMIQTLRGMASET